MLDVLIEKVCWQAEGKGVEWHSVACQSVGVTECLKCENDGRTGQPLCRTFYPPDTLHSSLINGRGGRGVGRRESGGGKSLGGGAGGSEENRRRAAWEKEVEFLQIPRNEKKCKGKRNS